jgi:polyferredoxin
MKYIVTGIRLLFLALFLYLIITGQMLLWLALYAASLILSVLFGRLYCGYACPMNTVMVPAEWLSEKLRFQTANAPKWLGKGYFAWLSLAVSVAAMLLSKKFLHMNLPILPFWLVLSFLLTLRYKPAVFHNLICPFGALQMVFGRFAILSKRVVNNACVGCKLCEKACPSEAITVSGENRKAVISTALCHQCTACQDACGKKAIRYGKKP